MIAQLSCVFWLTFSGLQTEKKRLYKVTITALVTLLSPQRWGT